jgi:hypothetical protein
MGTREITRLSVDVDPSVPPGPLTLPGAPGGGSPLLPGLDYVTTQVPKPDATDAVHVDVDLRDPVTSLVTTSSIDCQLPATMDDFEEVLVYAGPLLGLPGEHVHLRVTLRDYPAAGQLCDVSSPVERPFDIV